MPKHIRAFSLVELLAVIAIVAVLVAMTLPALQNARKAAWKALCASQERQLGIAMANYNQENAQYCPYGGPQTNRTGVSNSDPAKPDVIQPWVMSLSPYLGNFKGDSKPKIVMCPANPWPAWVYPVSSNDDNRFRPLTTYGLNDSTYPEFYFPVTKPWRKFSTVISPAETLMSGETTIGRAVDGAPSDFYAGHVTGGIGTNSTPLSTASVNMTTPTAAFGWWFTPEIGRRYDYYEPIVGFPHNLGWNSLMSDGSVKYHTKAQIIRLANTAPTTEKNIFWSNKR